ncbi:hypothetical protein M407DRAFT_40823, partial [Tulasnella calospora MUT 4182]
KTEVLPLGPISHRRGVVESRDLSGQPTVPENKLEDGVKIQSDGEAMRILGGWVGNKVDAETLWTPILQRMNKAASSWSKTGITFKGRKIVASTLILSRAQYMLTTNDPPDTVVKEVNRVIKKFM